MVVLAFVPAVAVPGVFAVDNRCSCTVAPADSHVVFAVDSRCSGAVVPANSPAVTVPGVFAVGSRYSGTVVPADSPAVAVPGVFAVDSRCSGAVVPADNQAVPEVFAVDSRYSGTVVPVDNQAVPEVFAVGTRYSGTVVPEDTLAVFVPAEGVRVVLVVDIRFVAGLMQDTHFFSLPAPSELKKQVYPVHTSPFPVFYQALYYLHAILISPETAE